MRAVMRRKAHDEQPFRANPVDIESAATDLQDRLGLRACWFEPWPYDRELPTIESGRIVLPADEPGVTPYSAWSADNGVALPVRSVPFEIGRFVLVPRTPTVGLAWASTDRDCALELANGCGRALHARVETEGSLA
jgi:hypothetical protein